MVAWASQGIVKESPFNWHFTPKIMQLINQECGRKYDIHLTQADLPLLFLDTL